MEFENFDAYRYLAAVYDTMTRDISFEEWVKYLISFFDRQKPTVLEYACGTGNISKKLAEYCSSMICVDNSSEMLLKAQEKFKQSNQDIRFVECDMSEFHLNKPVDYIICACDGVNYLTSEEEINLFFINACANIKSEGIFLFDISSEYKLSNILGNEFFYTDDDEATLFWQNAYNNDNHITQMDLTLFLKQDSVYYRYDEQHYQRAWSVDEIQTYLLNSGFKEVSAYSFGTRDNPWETDERIQFAAKK